MQSPGGEGAACSSSPGSFLWLLTVLQIRAGGSYIGNFRDGIPEVQEKADPGFPHFSGEEGPFPGGGGGGGQGSVEAEG